MAPDWQSAVEIHPAGWTLPADKFWVAGWVTSSSGLVPVDVRAWLGPQPFLGLCGLPRPDKEIAARGRAGPPQAGFSFLLSPVAGAGEIVIEVCDQSGRWAEIFRREVHGSANGSGPVQTSPPADAATVLRLLRLRVARPDESWDRLACEALAAGAAESFDVMPSAPFHGALEEVGDRTATPYGHLLVTGWIAHGDQRVVRLTAFLDTGVPEPLVHGLPRPDVASLFPGLVDAGHSRFAGFLRLPTRPPRPLALRIFAELADGQVALVFLKRFEPVLTGGYGDDLPGCSPWVFGRALRALRRAGWGRIGDAGGRRAAARAAWLEFQAAAPARSLPPAATDKGPVNPRPLRVTLVTHNLNFEGAPLFLAEYARYLAALPGWKVRVVSARAGPVQAVFDAAGVAVTVVDSAGLLGAASDGDFTAALDQLAAGFPWSDCDVIVANTLVASWAVHLAHRLRLPSVFYVHESVGARRFFALQLPAAAVARVERAFLLATRVAFIAAAVQRPHAAHGRRGNFRTLHGWIDLARIHAYTAAQDRAAVRRSLGLAPDAVVFANLGSLLPRKGQHVFVEAVALLLARSRRAAPPVFLLVGAGDEIDPYADVLRHAIQTRGLAGLQIIPRSAEPFRYFLAADICVCSSLEEAFPRVVLEAAAFGRLIVTTNVNGIPEMVGPDEAWLVPPDDPARLADAMAAAWESHVRGDRSRAEAARRNIARFDAAALLPRHADLVRIAAAVPFE